MSMPYDNDMIMLRRCVQGISSKGRERKFLLREFCYVDHFVDIWHDDKIAATVFLLTVF